MLRLIKALETSDFCGDKFSQCLKEESYYVLSLETSYLLARENLDFVGGWIWRSIESGGGSGSFAFVVVR
jgi:hypothetical protein